MIAIHHVTEPMPEAERNARVYSGEIIVFRGFGAVAALVDLLRARCEHALGEDPEQAHAHLPEHALADRVEELRRAVLKDETIARQLARTFAALGADVEQTCCDALKQRVQMANSESGRRPVGPLSPHRDTWGTNVMAQTNWWAPVYPTTPDRTIALYPTYFRRAIANDSEGWDFRELLRCLREQGPEPDYPFLPLASETPPADEALPISLVPGDLMCFSGAHLHASVPNHTERTRLSFETRTANGDDALAGRGAPNVDGRAVRTAYQLFRRLEDRAKLGEMV